LIGPVTLSTPLPVITALARSGALDRAWVLFEASGYLVAEANPAALAVKGRLLKDRGLKALGSARRALFAQSAAAYAAAHALAPAPYLLINVATLAFLSGDHARGAEMARGVLSLLDAGGPIAETPYWLAATRAEAYLLMGDMPHANAAMTSAIAHAPDSWTDHASTLRQFRLIHDETGISPAWLDTHRPPHSLHFAGHLGVSGRDEILLREQVHLILAEEKIGFGYGALAAGADIVIAECLLARGAALHVVLPVKRLAYALQSVTPYGCDWPTRYAACLEQADSVSEVTDLTGPFEPLTIGLASDVAMGAAVLNARALESGANQLIIADFGTGFFGTGAYAGRDAERWEATGHAQHIVRAARGASVEASGVARDPRPVPSRRLAAILHYIVSGTERLDDEDWPLIETEIFAPLRAAIAESATSPMSVAGWGSSRIMAFAEVEAAYSVARALLDRFAAMDLGGLGLPPSLGLTIGGHYDIVHVSPVDGDIVDEVYGRNVTMAADIVEQAHPGSLTVSAAFASALAFQTGPHVRAEHVGDLIDQSGEAAIKLFALRED
jgi:class 3 adenylate cyclase